MKKILITGAGGPAGVNFIRSLRDADEDFYLVGTDVNRFHLQWPDVDAAYQSPACSDPGYLGFINDLIRDECIEMIHPQPDVEVRFFSEHREQVNAKLALPDRKTIDILQDKHISGQMWEKAGISQTPSMVVEGLDDLHQAADVLGLPFWLRASQGAGGIGSTPVEDVEAAWHWIRYWRLRGKDWQFVAAQMLPGDNLAWTSLWQDGELIASQVRERLEYIYPYLAPSGITGTPVLAVTRDRSDVDQIAQRAVLAVDDKATGIFCVDLTGDSDGIPRPTEINCGRFFTTSYFFTAAGVNIPHMYIRMAYGEKLEPVQKGLEEGLYWVRHMDCPAVLCKEEELKAKPLNDEPSSADNS